MRQAGRTAEAVAALERAVQASPTQPRFFNELGIAYRINGQFAKAQEAYERALGLDAETYAPRRSISASCTTCISATAPRRSSCTTATSRWRPAATPRSRSGPPTCVSASRGPGGGTALNTNAQVAKGGKEAP